MYIFILSINLYFQSIDMFNQFLCSSNLHCQSVYICTQVICSISLYFQSHQFNQFSTISSIKQVQPINSISGWGFRLSGTTIQQEEVASQVFSTEPRARSFFGRPIPPHPALPRLPMSHPIPSYPISSLPIPTSPPPPPPPPPSPPHTHSGECLRLLPPLHTYGRSDLRPLAASAPSAGRTPRSALMRKL